jgi:hypothetical protein
MYQYEAKVLNVMNADCFLLRIKLGFDESKDVLIHLGNGFHYTDKSNEEILHLWAMEKWKEGHVVQVETYARVPDSHGEWLGFITDSSTGHLISDVMLEFWDKLECVNEDIAVSAIN